MSAKDLSARLTTAMVVLLLLLLSFVVLAVAFMIQPPVSQIVVDEPELCPSPERVNDAGNGCTTLLEGVPDGSTPRP